MAELKVEGESALVRDTSNNAIINKDRRAWREFKERRRSQKEKDATISNLQDEVDQLKKLVNQLLESQTPAKTTRSRKNTTKSE